VLIFAAKLHTRDRTIERHTQVVYCVCMSTAESQMRGVGFGTSIKGVVSAAVAQSD